MARRTRTPDQNTEDDTPSSHVAAIEAEREAGDEPQRAARPNPHSFISDSLAGVTYQTRREPYQAEIVFANGRPSDDVRVFMKDNGFKWDGDSKAWTLPIGFNTQAQDKVHARKIAYQVIDMIRKENGHEPALPQGQQPF